jgi:hypothetical protein
MIFRLDSDWLKGIELYSVVLKSLCKSNGLAAMISFSVIDFIITGSLLTKSILLGIKNLPLPNNNVVAPTALFLILNISI